MAFTKDELAAMAAADAAIDAEFAAKKRANPAQKEKDRERRRRYYEKNREKLIAYHREYYAKNRERLRAYRREYYARNKNKEDKANAPAALVGILHMSDGQIADFVNGKI